MALTYTAPTARGSELATVRSRRNVVSMEREQSAETILGGNGAETNSAGIPIDASTPGRGKQPRERSRPVEDRIESTLHFRLHSVRGNSPTLELRRGKGTVEASAGLGRSMSRPGTTLRVPERVANEPRGTSEFSGWTTRAEVRGSGSLDARSREATGSRDGDRRRRGGGGGRSGRPRQRRAFHREASSAVAAGPPRPLQRPDQGVPEVLREQAVDVERDRVIDHFQQVSQGSEHLEMS